MQQKQNRPTTVTNPAHPSRSSKPNQPPGQGKARRDTHRELRTKANQRFSANSHETNNVGRKKRVSYHAHIISTIHTSTFPKQPKTIYKAASERRRLNEPPNTRGEEKKAIANKQPPAKRKKFALCKTKKNLYRTMDIK